MAKDENSLIALRDIVLAMEKATVLAAGDIMLDRFVYGDVNRISPESPVPVLLVREEINMLGGVGNVLANLAGLGARPCVAALVGDDAAGESIRQMAAEKGADISALLTDPARSTTEKARFIASHQQMLRADIERIVPSGAALEKALLAKVDAMLAGNIGAVILSDYGKGALTPALIAAVIARAAQKKIPVLVDPKGDNYSIYKGAAIVTPNKKELSLATGMPANTDAEVVAAAQKLMETAGIGAVVATRSQDGMTIVARGKQPVHLRTEALEVFDVSGAGDTVIATLAAALAAGADLVQAAAIANAAAGLVVAKVGTAPVRRTELLAALDRKDVSFRPREQGGAVVDTVREAAQCTTDEAAEIVQRWKARRLRVGFTNGCFDILHRGHVAYLNHARDHCDRLIVALNIDDSIRRLKGASRPINTQDARAAVIGALGAVDMVILFGADEADADKPLNLLRRLRPDVYFKGGDYKIEQLEEAPLVRAYGGEMAIMPLTEGHSTTATIKKMKGQAG